MYRIVHVFLGLSTGLLICSSSPYSVLCGLSSALGAYIPDIKHAPYRRGKISHSLVTPIVITIIMFSIENSIFALIRYRLVTSIVTTIVYSTCLGWVTHVLSDSLTSQGVCILYPFSNYRLRVFKNLRSDSIIGNLSILFLSSILIYVWLVETGYDRIIHRLIKTISSILT